MFERADFPMERVMQGKGSIFYRQWKPCGTLKRAATHKIKLDQEKCLATSVPVCTYCKRVMRPNVNLMEDMNWLESQAKA